MTPVAAAPAQPLSPEAPATEPAPVVEFVAGDLAVHPSHGVGRVARIEERGTNAGPAAFYVLEILESRLKVMVPVEAAARVGLRRVMGRAESDEILAVLRAPEVAVGAQPWNRRFRAYSDMVKSGQPLEIAKVLRDMNRLRTGKELSFGERRLLDQARGLLLQELALARRVPASEVEQEIDAIFAG